MTSAYIPARMMGGIRRYVDHGVQPGDFLTAVICNDLRGACERADSENEPIISHYVRHFYNEEPATCWGSREKMDFWLEQHAAKRAEETT